MRKLTFRRLWLYYLIFISVLIFIVPVLLFYVNLVPRALPEDTSVIEEPRGIVEIYRKAGLQGAVLDLYEPYIYNERNRVDYTYEENNFGYYFDIPFKAFREEPTYDYKNIVDLYTNPNESERSAYDHFLFREFFDQALFNGESLKAYQIDRAKSLGELGLKEVQIYLETPYYYLDDKTKSLFNRELKKDLEVANRDGYVPVYGINTLDSLKYWSLSSSYMIISSNSSIDQFLAVKDKLNPELWKPGYYKVEDRLGEVYSTFQVDNQGIWSAVEEPKVS